MQGLLHLGFLVSGILLMLLLSEGSLLTRASIDTLNGSYASYFGHLEFSTSQGRTLLFSCHPVLLSVELGLHVDPDLARLYLLPLAWALHLTIEVLWQSIRRLLEL